MGGDQHARRQELAAGLDTVQSRITAACQAAGRDPAGVTLIVITKYFPVSDVLLLHELGVRAFGENKDQEAATKYAQVREVLAVAPLGTGRQTAQDVLALHFVGRLQSNKARHVGSYADVVHSVDRAKLVRGLAAGAAERDRRLSVLLQVSLDGDVSRGGVVIADVPALASEVAASTDLDLKGVMAVAPLDADPDESFARLAEVSQALRVEHPGADWVSAGMSGDLEAAIRHGATHLRVGTAILGSRPSLL